LPAIAALNLESVRIVDVHPELVGKVVGTLSVCPKLRHIEVRTYCGACDEDDDVKDVNALRLRLQAALSPEAVIKWESR